MQAPLPLLVGGKGDSDARLVARHADEWNMWSVPSTFAERSSALDEACEREGRDPATIRRSTQMVVFPVADPAKGARPWNRWRRARRWRAPHSLAEQFAAYAEVGVDEIIVPTRTLGEGSQRADSWPCCSPCAAAYWPPAG